MMQDKTRQTIIDLRRENSYYQITCKMLDGCFIVKQKGDICVHKYLKCHLLFIIKQYHCLIRPIKENAFMLCSNKPLQPD